MRATTMRLSTCPRMVVMEWPGRGDHARSKIRRNWRPREGTSLQLVPAGLWDQSCALSVTPRWDRKCP